MKKTLLVTILALLGSGSVFATQTPDDEKPEIEITRYDYGAGHFGSLLGSDDPARNWWKNNRKKHAYAWCLDKNGLEHDLWLGPYEGKWQNVRCRDNSFRYRYQD